MVVKTQKNIKKGSYAETGDWTVLLGRLEGVSNPELDSIKIEARARKYGASTGMRATNRSVVVKKLREGLPTDSYDRLAKSLGVTASELGRIVNIAPRTLQRRRQSGRLLRDESERVYRIARVFDHAVDVLEGRERARTWFKSPIRALGGATPFDYCDTELGAREVDDVIGRIEHGVFS